MAVRSLGTLPHRKDLASGCSYPHDEVYLASSVVWKWAIRGRRGMLPWLVPRRKSSHPDCRDSRVGYDVHLVCCTNCPQMYSSNIYSVPGTVPRARVQW